VRRAPWAASPFRLSHFDDVSAVHEHAPPARRGPEGAVLVRHAARWLPRGRRPALSLTGVISFKGGHRALFLHHGVLLLCARLSLLFDEQTWDLAPHIGLVAASLLVRSRIASSPGMAATRPQTRPLRLCKVKERPTPCAATRRCPRACFMRATAYRVPLPVDKEWRPLSSFHGCLANMCVLLRFSHSERSLSRKSDPHAPGKREKD